MRTELSMVALRRDLAKIADKVPRSGRLVTCSLCGDGFMELVPSDQRNFYLAEHLFHDHELDFDTICEHLK